MGAIADFKKRRAAERAQQANVAEAKEQVSETKAPENEALALLAALLGCDVDQAIEQAKELVEKGAYIAGLTEEQLDAVQQQIGFDPAHGEDKAVIVNVKGGQIESVTELAKQTATDLEQSAGAVEGAADAVTGAAEQVGSAAEQVGSAAADLEDTASQLAYTADDIGQATAELKEATAELKKPSAGQESLPGETAAKRKNNSKK
jgi:uncharacterized phage infection (PIP) family protein YhgE